MCGSGVLNKDDVGLEKVQGVTVIKGKEWLLDGSDGLDPYFLVWYGDSWDGAWRE